MTENQKGRSLDPALRRRACYGKVAPETRAYLDHMEEKNDGRRIDRLVEIVRKLKKRR